MPLSDAEQSKLLAVIGYIPPLFFIPLFMSKSPFAHFHGKQALVLFIAFAALWVVAIVFSFIPLIGYLLIRLLDLILLIAMFAGMYTAYKNEYWEMPVLGSVAKGLKF